jgi:tyrosine-protein kinase Etk/Wzc
MVDEEGFQEPEPIRIVDLVNVVLKRRRLIASGVLVAVLLAVIGSGRVKPTFTASAKFLPSRDPNMSSRMATLVGAGEIKSFEQNVTSEYYGELLQGSDFLARIAKKKYRSREMGGETDLVRYYGLEGRNDAEKLARTVVKLTKTLKVSVNAKTKVVTLSYSAHEPELAAAIVNDILGELETYSNEMRGFRTRRNREFVEAQLRESQKLLLKAEKDLSDFGRRNVKIAGLPELEAERDRLKRGVTVHEQVYLMLRKQLELVTFEEQEAKATIEIVERAAVPLQKSAPARAAIVVLAALGGLVAFGGLAFVLEAVSSIDPNDSSNRELLQHVHDIRHDLLAPFRLLGFGGKKHSPAKGAAEGIPEARR